MDKLCSNKNSCTLLDHGIQLDGHGLVEAENAFLFIVNGNANSFTSVENIRMLFMSGKSLNEPMQSHGPFVMNSKS